MTADARCLDDEVVLRLVQRRLGEAERAAVEEHIRGCADCRTLVAETAKAFFHEPGAAEGVGTVGRYVLREARGAGGAGVVYVAHDPRLRRDVAVKLVSPAGGGDDEALARLLREAQAMAQLAHPNVVAVHDAGIHAGQVYIVMELVRGTTLSEWRSARPRSWREVIAVLAEAGRGLAAAHAAGLVHRDFKPDNVLVGEDGRARVTDFGLARPVATPRGEIASGAGGLSPPEPIAGGFGDPLGVPEKIAGTPTYMAPEQIRGGTTDARTDQFSFCVTLYQALHGQRPFEGPTLAALAAEMDAGRVRPPPRGGDVPAAVHTVLLRGLGADPAGRFPSMTALLDELARTAAPAGRARPRVVAAIAIVAAASAALLLARGRGGQAPLIAGARCGNGVVEPGEECDDGNASDADACLPSCRFAACGDGHLRRAVEECDDGNRADGDGCSAACLRCDDGDARLAWDTTGHCYTRHDRPLPWADASAACNAGGGNLVSYGSSRELTAVVAGLLHGTDGAYWVGLSDATRKGAYGWINADPFDLHYRNWDALHAPDGRCAAQRAGELWAADPCTSAHGYLCERGAWTLRARDNHAYRPLHRPVAWAEARDACAAAGAHLVTVSSAEENQFLVASFAGSYWIGASKAAPGQDFAWVTAERLSERLFGPGDPDMVTTPACVALGADHLWHDRPCDGPEGVGRLPFICEVD